MDGSWEYYDCCGDLQFGSGVGIEVCVNSLLPYNGVTISPTYCSISCTSAAEFIKCIDGTIFYGLADSDTAFVGATYLYSGECYSFVQFGGPGGPDLGTPDFGDCITCLNTPQPPIPPPPVSPSQTPTITPTPPICSASTFCLKTTLTTLSGYSGNYTSTSLFYNSRLYYSGNGVTYGVIYYTGDRWCLSSSLGGTCLLEGAYPCYSVCPDISANLFTSGPCPSPTPSVTDCDNFDFVAYFDCDVPNTPSPTPTNTQTPTNTPTPTITPTIPCNVGVSFSICSYGQVSPTPTPTPTPTPASLCEVQGQVSFVMLDEVFTCTSVKVLVDCANTNIEYYVVNDLLFNGIPIQTGVTMSVIINGESLCVTYVRDDENISSNSNVNSIIQIYGGCGSCVPPQSPSPTPTPTTTPTPTITPTKTSTPTPTITPTKTSTPTPTKTLTPTPTKTSTPTPTPTNTSTPTPTETPTPTVTPSGCICTSEQCTCLLIDTNFQVLATGNTVNPDLNNKIFITYKNCDGCVVTLETTSQQFTRCTCDGTLISASFWQDDNEISTTSFPWNPYPSSPYSFGFISRGPCSGDPCL